MSACPMCPRLCFAYMYVFSVHVFGAHMNACVDECATAWGHERQQALECSRGVNGEPSRFHSPLWHALSEISHHIKFVFHRGHAQLDPYLRLFIQSWTCEIGCHLFWAIQFQRSACGSVKGKKIEMMDCQAHADAVLGWFLVFLMKAVASIPLSRCSTDNLSIVKCGITGCALRDGEKPTVEWGRRR